MHDFHSLFFYDGRMDPHRVLGVHSSGRCLRLWRPKSVLATVIVHGKEIALRSCGRGIFEGTFPEPLGAKDYLVTYPSGLQGCDPYAFSPTITEADEALLSKGKHWDIYRVLGAHCKEHEGVLGVQFAVWAPCAAQVVLMGDFNRWSEALCPMRQMGNSGVWELFVPGLREGETYQFGIYTREKKFLRKADPYAFQGEMRPSTKSIVAKFDQYVWSDHAWLKKRRDAQALNRPLHIYELHLGSWRREQGGFSSYRKLAKQLAVYARAMQYTHIELLPIMGHPLDESWGYQVSGYYAISRRYGKIEDFQHFVNALHEQGIGVILDWVPGHFPTDPHALAHFDGTCLYEHRDPKQGFHPQWTTHVFNFGRYEVRNFLLGSALFYLREMHVDGLRIDAVSSMVYLDFARKEGEWIPNAQGSNENLEAISFLQELTTRIKEEFPSALLCAEESHAFPGVTRSLEEGGLGFDLKWSLGWMHDTLRYFAHPLEKRGAHLHELVHTLSYAFDQRHILALSHDEVVHQKKKPFSKNAGG